MHNIKYERSKLNMSLTCKHLWLTHLPHARTHIHTHTHTHTVTHTHTHTHTYTHTTKHTQNNQWYISQYRAVSTATTTHISCHLKVITHRLHFIVSIHPTPKDRALPGADETQTEWLSSYWCRWWCCGDGSGEIAGRSWTSAKQEQMMNNL